MEVIPPSNSQNLSLTDEAVNQPEAQTNKTWKIFDFIRTSVLELFLIALFSILILATFNYFNLIPLSSIFPALSFLPQQNPVQKIINTTSQDDITFFNSNISSLSACDPNLDKNIILNPIITCKNPTKISNTGKNPIYQWIANSNAVSDNEMQINFALKITQGKNYNPSGLLFGGGPEENRLSLIYDNNTSSWGVMFIYGKTVTPFESIYAVNSSPIQRSNFSILISKDGKQVTILLPNGLMKSYTLKGSLYAKDGTIPSTAVAYPNSEVDIYSLNYYTPQ